VAMTTCWRWPRLLSQLPIMLSDSPPLLPGAHLEYTSAVSIKLNPAPTKASSRLKEVDSSTVQPKTFPPKARGETSNPELPSLRICMFASFKDWIHSDRKKDAAQGATLSDNGAAGLSRRTAERIPLTVNL